MQSAVCGTWKSSTHFVLPLSVGVTGVHEAREGAVNYVEHQLSHVDSSWMTWKTLLYYAV